MMTKGLSFLRSSLRSLTLGLAALSLLPMLLLGAPARSDEIVYAGTFDPFHNTHYDEVRGTLRAFPSAKLRILPIASAYYNRFEGVDQPQLFPYDLRARLIEDSFAGQSRVSVRKDLRTIEGDVLGTFIRYLESIRDPKRFLLVGPDVLNTWKDLPDFERLLSSASLIVTEDPRDPDLGRALQERFSGNPRIRFFNPEVEGIRSVDLNRSVITGDLEKVRTLAPPAFADFLERHPEEREAITLDYLKRLRDYSRHLVRHESIPLFRKKLTGDSAALIAAIEGDVTLQDELARMDFSSPVRTREFIEKAAKAAGVPAERLSSRVIPDWSAILSSPELAATRTARSARFIRTLDFAPLARAAANAPLAPPPYLFHWTSHSKLVRMAAETPKAGALPLRTLRADQTVVIHHPELAGKPGIYTTSHPVTGISISPSEVYGRPEDGHPGRLLVLKPKRDARVVRIQTTAQNAKGEKIPGIENADLLYNETFGADGKLMYREWIVLNPEAIENFTADPQAMREVLQQELARLKSGNPNYAPEERFSLGSLDVKTWTTVLEQYLTAGAEGIPPSLLRPFAAAPARGCLTPKLAELTAP